MVVVLPAPLGPSKQNSCPRSMPNQVPRMAQKSSRRRPPVYHLLPSLLLPPAAVTTPTMPSSPLSSAWGCVQGLHMNAGRHEMGVRPPLNTLRRPYSSAAYFVGEKLSVAVRLLVAGGMWCSGSLLVS